MVSDGIFASQTARESAPEIALEFAESRTQGEQLLVTGN
jgi:hypothetical protein